MTNGGGQTQQGQQGQQPASTGQAPASPASTKATGSNFDFKAVQPETFSGLATEYPSRWMKSFENYCKAKKIEDHQRSALFKLLLRSVALIWIEEYDPTDSIPWDKLKTEFLTHFENPASRWHYQNQLDERRLKSSEAPDTYINDVLQLAPRLKLSTDAQLKALVRGLPPDLKSSVLYKNPKTLNDAIQAIHLGSMCEKLKQSDSPSSSACTVPDVSTKLADTCKAVTDQIDSKINKLDHLTNKLCNININDVPLNTTKGPPLNYAHHYPPLHRTAQHMRPNYRSIVRKSRPSSHYLQPNRGPQRTCYCCGSPEHLIRQCPFNYGRPRDVPTFQKSTPHNWQPRRPAQLN